MYSSQPIGNSYLFDGICRDYMVLIIQLRTRREMITNIKTLGGLYRHGSWFHPNQRASYRRASSMLLCYVDIAHLQDSNPRLVPFTRLDSNRKAKDSRTKTGRTSGHAGQAQNFSLKPCDLYTQKDTLQESSIIYSTFLYNLECSLPARCQPLLETPNPPLGKGCCPCKSRQIG